MDENPALHETPKEPQDVAPAPRREVRHFKAVNIIYYVTGVIEVFLVFRFLFHLLAANASSGIVMFVDNVSAPFMAPFNMIFPTSTIGNSTFEWPVLLAMAIYLVVAFGIVQLINVFVARAPQEEM
jgi:YggT family protein